MDLRHFTTDSALSSNNHIALCTLCTVVILLSQYGCCRMFGSYPLDKNLYDFNPANSHERMIIYNDNLLSIIWGCNSGVPIVPNNENYQHNCKMGMTEYVDSVKCDDNWIIAHSILINKGQQDENYWIIQKGHSNLKDVEKATIGPMKFEEFYLFIKSNKISLKFF